MYDMIEFVLKDRPMRLIDGVFYARAMRNGKETKKEIWRKIKFSNTIGYLSCSMIVDGMSARLYQHRLVYYAHHQDWDIFDGSSNNVVDHYNRDRSDNRLENLHIVTSQQNAFNTNAKGYSWYKTRNKWEAYIKINGRNIKLGYFEKEEDARNAYLKEKAKLHII